MIAATNSVLHGDKGIQEASRLYNVPFETLRRQITGSVVDGRRPRPNTVTEEEEEQLVRKCLRWVLV